jgi:hypothetical protein
MEDSAKLETSSPFDLEVASGPSTPLELSPAFRNHLEQVDRPSDTCGQPAFSSTSNVPNPHHPAPLALP